MKSQKQSQQGSDKKAGSRESLSSNKSSVYADKPTDKLIKEIEERRIYLEKDVDVKRILPKGSVFRLDLEYNKLKAEAKGQLEAFKKDVERVDNFEHLVESSPRIYRVDIELFKPVIKRLKQQIQKDIKLLEGVLNGK